MKFRNHSIGKLPRAGHRLALTRDVGGTQTIGQYGIDTINNMDVNGVVAVTAFAGVCVLSGAVLSDIMVAILDPRVRLG